MSSDQRREVGNQAYNTSCCLVEVVERTPPSQQSKLVQFLYQLREKTVTDPITSEPLKVDGEVVWTDLPTLGYTWADEINSFCKQLSVRLEDTPDKLQRWENLSAYFARLTASSSNMDFSRTGIWVLQTAFEPEKPLERELAAIRMACFWLIYAADILWANANGRDNNGKDVGCGKRFQGRKWKGFSRDRWSFWEERLLEAQVIYTSGETKELIEDALAQMKRASTE
ncbi:hypothetical protein BT96DRAFT_856685 [Gymnopus androsaceus JB14]|uniref:Uncharacterized protein n=1 Tax=Gymnopus androsaceus JB14 TaxID=1447944 RepID=A0A6A4HXB6_9AGAR|nr:hypothetical protein BT96DRAFT_856685 [Gymnopus androsaceus JB14]